MKAIISLICYCKKIDKSKEEDHDINMHNFTSIFMQTLACNMEDTIIKNEKTTVSIIDQLRKDKVINSFTVTFKGNHCTLLESMVMSKNKKLVSYALKSGADPNSRINGTTILVFWGCHTKDSTSNDEFDIFRLLYKKCTISINSIGTFDERYPQLNDKTLFYILCENFATTKKDNKSMLLKCILYAIKKGAQVKFIKNNVSCGQLFRTAIINRPKGLDKLYVPREILVEICDGTVVIETPEMIPLSEEDKNRYIMNILSDVNRIYGEDKKEICFGREKIPYYKFMEKMVKERQDINDSMT
jgi:hypothetical protein